MRVRPVLLLPAALLAVTAATACSSSTGGTGGTGRGAGATASTGGFPAGSTPAAPGSGAPATAGSTSGSASGGVSSGSGSSGASATSTTHPVPAQPLLVSSVVAASGTTYVVKVWADVSTTDCRAHAYGKAMLAFLKKHACVGMRRRLVTTTVGGRDVGFQLTSISFGGSSTNDVYEVAAAFDTLVTKDGTGNLDDLLREGYRLPTGPTSVPSPDAFHAQTQDNSVTVVDAWYLSGTTPDNDPPLVRMAEDVFLQF